MDMRKRHHNRSYAKAVHFSLILVSLMMVSVSMAFYQAPPIVLGTEMNADGSVEYLCLGGGCEGLRPFHWAD